MKTAFVCGFIIVATTGQTWAAEKLLRFPAGDNSVVISPSKRTVDLITQNGPMSLDVPYHGPLDEWLSATVTPLGNRQFLELKIWSTSKGTSDEVSYLWWYVYEVNDNGFQCITASKTEEWHPNEKKKRRRVPKLELKIIKDQLRFFRNEKPYTPPATCDG